MNATYRNAIANHGAGLITHIGIVNDIGVELSGGPPGEEYARQAVTWTAADDGLIRPDADLSFYVPAGAVVDGWRGFSALSGGTNYGGKRVKRTPYVGAGTYELIAAENSIRHQ